MLMTANRRIRVALGMLESANLLLLKLWRRNRAAARLYPGVMFRDYVFLANGDRWKSGSIFDFMPELLDQPTRVTLEHLSGEGLFAPVNELALMALVTQGLEPSRIFEIGTYRGRTALNFALNSPPECEIFTLDLPADPDAVQAASLFSNGADARLIERRAVGADYEGRPEAAKITQILGDSRSFDFGPYKGTCDLVFVDGGHTYDLVVNDTHWALEMCRPGGIILWHDFANYGDYHDVTRAVLDLLPRDEIFQLEDSQLAGYRLPSRVA